MQLRMNEIWISLGANIPGTWGSPRTAVHKAILELQKRNFHVFARSALYSTPPLGPVRQPYYLNMVIGARAPLGPFALLRLLNRLELSAGRRVNGRWHARPLDLDVLDYGGRVLGNASVQRRRGQIVLPHPEMHRRGFVMVPLAQVAPGWRHPTLGIAARQLLERHPSLRYGIRRLTGKRS